MQFELLEDVAQRYGEPFYILDLERFAGNLERFLAAFTAHYASTRVAYSYKTNYTPALCRRAHESGASAEVVSRLELDLALRLGVPGERIIFNGPVKSRDDLIVARQAGALVNLDGMAQVEAVEALARGSADPPLRVGLRVAFPVDGAPHSRFGFPAEFPLLAQIVERLAILPGVKLVALHAHFVTVTRAADVYRWIAERMLQLAAELFSARNLRLEQLNLGGGFFSPMAPELASQFGVPIPDYKDYGAAIGGAFQQFDWGDMPRAELVLEPGISVAADCGWFATRVLDTRQHHTRRLAVVSGSIHDVKPTWHRRRLAVAVVTAPQTRRRLAGPIDVVGSTCLEDDVLLSGFDRPLAVGDWLIVSQVGAYTNVLRPPFITGCPAIISHTAQDGVVLLRRRDECDEVYASYVF